LVGKRGGKSGQKLACVGFKDLRKTHSKNQWVLWGRGTETKMGRVQKTGSVTWADQT